MFHNFTTLEEMHVEITNRCNAACPMCARNHFGGKEKDGLELSEWTVEEAEKVFSPKFQKLRNILFCGTHGDPAAAKSCLEVAEVARRQTGATFEFYSNGSIKSKDWWFDLGQLMSFRKDDDHYRKYDLGIFSVDGLADTNHLYRRQTRFEKIMENAEAFIRGGGKARWDFIVFKHNEHQVEEAEKLAYKMGFKQFRIRKTSRFAYSPDGPEKHRVLDRNGNVEYYLEPASQEEYLNKEKKTFEKIMDQERSGNLNLKEEIRCLNRSQFNRMYINANLKVFPCCFISNDTYPGEGKVFRDTKSRVVEKFGINFNSLRETDWDSIIDHPWYKQDLVASWDSESDKLIRCQRTCSVKCDPITSQSQTRALSL